MASANVTLGDSGCQFECDTTERTATLTKFGGYVRNVHATVSVFLHVEAGTVVTTNPIGVGGREVKAGQTVQLPAHCKSFTFKTAAGTSYVEYTREAP